MLRRVKLTIGLDKPIGPSEPPAPGEEFKSCYFDFARTHGFTTFARNEERHHHCQIQLVLDWRRALQLLAETVREIGILVVVFVPVDYAFAERPIGSGLVIVVAMAGIGIVCAIVVESINFK